MMESQENLEALFFYAIATLAWIDAEDQIMALQEDRQGLGLSRRRTE